MILKRTLDLTQLDAKYTRKLNEIAANCKKEYTEFVDKYSRRYGSNHLWWALPFSSRNIYLDETFQNICYLDLCQWVIHNGEIDRIIVANKALRDTLLINYKQELASKGITLECHAKGFRLYAITIGMLRSLKTEFKEFCQIRKYGGRKKYGMKDAITLIDTPVLSSSFESGRYKDRYFSGIQKYTEHNIYFLPSLMRNTSTSWMEFMKCVRISTDYKFLLKHDFLKLSDFFEVLRYFLFCVQLSLRRYKYRDIDVTPLIKESLLRGCACAPSLKGVLNYQFIKRLSKSEIKIECLISWYEGRPSEIMMQKAFRKYYPKVKCVGYIGFPYFELSLGEYISKEQYKQKAAPLKMTVPGAIYEKQARQFCKELSLIRVPILRNSYVYAHKDVNVTVGSNKKILVVLPYFKEAAADILHILNKYIKLHSEADYHISVKNHPAFKGKTADYYLNENLCFSPQYVEGDLVECVQGIDCALLSCSTASLEILSQGVFLVNLCPRGKLRSTAIPDEIDEKLYKIVYNEEELFEALDFGMGEGRGFTATLDMTEILEPINEETINRMWD